MNGLCELLEMLFEFYRKEDWFNEHNICTYAGYILRIDCAKAEEGLKTTPNSD